MNRCIFSGYLFDKPQLKESLSGKSVCEFRMSVPRGYKSSDGERKSDFITVVAWGQTAEKIARYCDKGVKLNIETHVRTELYTDKNGVKRESHKYEVDFFEFAERRSASDGKGEAAPQGDEERRNEDVPPARNAQYESPAPSFGTLSDDEELPF